MHHSIQKILRRESRSDWCDFWQRVRAGLIGLAVLLFLKWVLQ
jgi:hypothetical protein